MTIDELKYIIKQGPNNTNCPFNEKNIIIDCEKNINACEFKKYRIEKCNEFTCPPHALYDWAVKEYKLKKIDEIIK